MEDIQQEQQLTEHDQAMVDLVDNKAAAANGQANPDEAPEYVEPTEPIPLPEKFKSQEDLIKAYNALEQKLHSNQSESEPELEASTEDVHEQPEATTDNSSKDTDEVTVDVNTIVDSIVSGNTEVTPEMKDALIAGGMTEATIESLINVGNVKVTEIKNDLYSTVGGEESYDSLMEQAGDVLSDDEIDSYNEVLSSGNLGAMKLALRGLAAAVNPSGDTQQYTRPVRGSSTPQAPQGKSFDDKGEMFKAMNNKLYGKDPSYTRMVENKIAMSNF